MTSIPSRAAESVFGLSGGIRRPFDIRSDPVDTHQSGSDRARPRRRRGGGDGRHIHRARPAGAARGIGALARARDYTIKLDLDGYLLPGQRYFYRFVYNRTVSRTGPLPHAARARCDTREPAARFRHVSGFSSRLLQCVRAHCRG